MDENIDTSRTITLPDKRRFRSDACLLLLEPTRAGEDREDDSALDEGSGEVAAAVPVSTISLGSGLAVVPDFGVNIIQNAVICIKNI